MQSYDNTVALLYIPWKSRPYFDNSYRAVAENLVFDLRGDCEMQMKEIVTNCFSNNWSEQNFLSHYCGFIKFYFIYLLTFSNLWRGCDPPATSMTRRRRSVPVLFWQWRQKVTDKISLLSGRRMKSVGAEFKYLLLDHTQELWLLWMPLKIAYLLLVYRDIKNQMGTLGSVEMSTTIQEHIICRVSWQK